MTTRLTVSVPAEAEPGGYWCVLTVDELPDPLAVSEGVGIRFMASVSIGVFVYVGEQQRAAEITAVEILNDSAVVKLRNDGNTPLAIEGRFEFVKPGATEPAAVVALARSTLLTAADSDGCVLGQAAGSPRAAVGPLPGARDHRLRRRSLHRHGAGDGYRAVRPVPARRCAAHRAASHGDAGRIAASARTRVAGVRRRATRASSDRRVATPRLSRAQSPGRRLLACRVAILTPAPCTDVPPRPADRPDGSRAARRLVHVRDQEDAGRIGRNRAVGRRPADRASHRAGRCQAAAAARCAAALDRARLSPGRRLGRGHLGRPEKSTACRSTSARSSPQGRWDSSREAGTFDLLARRQVARRGGRPVFGSPRPGSRRTRRPGAPDRSGRHRSPCTCRVDGMSNGTTVVAYRDRFQLLPRVRLGGEVTSDGAAFLQGQYAPAEARSHRVLPFHARPVAGRDKGISGGARRSAAASPCRARSGCRTPWAIPADGSSPRSGCPWRGRPASRSSARGGPARPTTARPTR